MSDEEIGCTECGNDLCTEGYLVCMDCLELLGDDAPTRVVGIHQEASRKQAL